MLSFLCCRCEVWTTAWQEINLAWKRGSLSWNIIGRPKTPLKCKDDSEWNSQDCHQRAGPLLASKRNLKQMEPSRTSTRNVLDDLGHPRALEKKSRCRKHLRSPQKSLNKLLGKQTLHLLRCLFPEQFVEGISVVIVRVFPAPALLFQGSWMSKVVQNV